LAARRGLGEGLKIDADGPAQNQVDPRAEAPGVESAPSIEGWVPEHVVAVGDRAAVAAAAGDGTVSTAGRSVPRFRVEDPQSPSARNSSRRDALVRRGGSAGMRRPVPPLLVVGL
jgi:hypothetical protein